MLDWSLYTPSPNRECLYEVTSPGKIPEKTQSMTQFPLKGVLGVKGALGAPRTRARQKVLQNWTSFGARARRAQGPIHPEDPFHFFLRWTDYFIPRPVQVKTLNKFGGINNVWKKYAINSVCKYDKHIVVKQCQCWAWQTVTQCCRKTFSLEKAKNKMLTTSISIFVWLSVSFGFKVIWSLLEFPPLRSIIFPQSLNVTPQFYR